MLSRAATVAAILATAAVLGVLLAQAFGSDDGDGGGPAAASAERDAAETRLAQERLRGRLAAGVAQASELGAEVQAAAWIPGQPAPALAGSDLDEQVRLWSMSKPFAAIATLRAVGSAEPAWMGDALEALIVRSENCPTRALMLELQRRTGSVAGARRALAAVFDEGGAGGVTIADEVEPPDLECRERLEAAGVPSADSEALLTGTSTWTVGEAIRSTQALAAGRYGAPGERLLALMRRPKSASEEISRPSDYTADPAWGAGRALAAWHPSYKAGWGGVAQGSFMAGQIVVVRRGACAASAAVMVHPTTQPGLDDPGRSVAPLAVETVLRAVRPSLPPAGGGGGGGENCE